MSSHVRRLVSLIRTLASSLDGMTIAHLATLHKVSQKTVRRDLECLKEMGCKIIDAATDKGKKHYKLSETSGFALHLAFDEALALFIGCHTSPAYRDLGLGRAAASSLNKLRTVLGNRESQFIEAQLPRFYRTSVGSHYAHQAEWIDQLQLAIEDRQVVNLRYRSAARREPVTYEIHPYGLVEHRGTLYMVGYSALRESIRTWKLDRVAGVELSSSKFDVPGDFHLQEYMQEAFAVIRGEELVRVKIRLQPDAARYVQEKRMHSSQRCTVHPDGTATLEFQLSSLIEIKSWILSFGSQAEVLEPEELREQISLEVKQLADRYLPSKATGNHRRRTAK